MNKTIQSKGGRIAVGALLAGILAAGSAAPAFAAGTATAQAWRNLLYVEGTPVQCVDAKGAAMPFLEYQGSVYVTLRSVGQWMGKEVGWDAATQTVLLSGEREPETQASTTYAPEQGSLTIEPAPEVKIQVDGQVRSFTGADGKPVYPLLYRDTTYLPVRAVGELLGLEVEWSQEGAVESVRIQNALTESQRQQLETYVRAALPLANQVMQTYAALQNCPDDAEKALALCEDLQDTLGQLSELERPRITSCSLHYEELDANIARAMERTEKFQKAVQDGAKPADSYTILDASQPGTNDYFGDQYIQAEIAALGQYAGLTVDLGEYGNGKIL
ncbi:MAG: copper amine oxidase N-terminal domain-containing protein [Butyricicoccus sp.]|nr:copper amine oxidase N-terminal domain-containing protein [Butyricicoccus sp.]